MKINISLKRLFLTPQMSRNSDHEIQRVFVAKNR